MAHYLTVQQAAEYLNISPHTLYKLLEKGKVPAGKIGGSWRFNRERLDQFLAGSTVIDSPNVLVMEPDDVARAYLADVARSRGAQVFPVAGEQQAIDVAKMGIPIHLALCAVSGDAGTGAAFLDAITATQPDCTVWLMVEAGGAASLEPLLARGRVYALRKPVERPELVNLISLISR